MQTEEACKNAFVMPFLNALGFDVFNPEIVVPEFTADVGLKKGEKVDYAIKIGGKISVLVECKGCGTNLATTHMSQLYRYFSVTEARFAILTNGIEYWFFSDLDAPNKMDQRPFFQFDLLNHRSDDLVELQKFRCEHFDESVILSTASNLKYSSAIKSEFLKEIAQPSEEFMKILVSRVFEGSFTQKVKEKFAPLVGAAIRDAVRDMVNERLTSALEVSSGARPPVVPVSEIAVPQAAAATADPEVVTTEEEVEAFHIIKALVRSTIKAERIVMRDAKSYCAILVDDNNRRPLARLHFNSKSIKYLGLFNGKDEERIKIERLEDIYGYADRLQQTASAYLE
ncbi:MAG TPA: type I restriction endonuclease [Azospirillaceae bacterium]|nr:type I restriction endonuclease [Azospirillaceae bacterium]